ncbi:unnamed protein product [Choristocarpus tenellus]
MVKGIAPSVLEPRDRERRWWSLTAIFLLLARSSYVVSFRCHPCQRRSSIISVHSLQSRVHHRPRVLYMKEKSSSDAEKEFCDGRLNDLITIQAQLTATHYWMELRGNMYAEWMSRYNKEVGGVQALGWKSFLGGMLRAPPEEIVVKKLIKKPRGGSGTNPFLKDREFSYTEIIYPAKIAQQIMSIREQLAEHLGKDLELVVQENAELKRHYNDELELGADKALRLRMTNWTVRQERDPSSGISNPPRRVAAYDKAVELITASSVRRLQKQLQVHGDRHTLSWLEKLCNEELEKRQGNELIKAILEGPIVLVNKPGRDTKIIEPLKVAQAIMQFREEVAEECIEVLASVPQDHNQLTVSLLNEQWKMTPFDFDLRGEDDGM